MIKLKYMDERFFAYRQRSMGIAGFVGALVAWCLFTYRFVGQHVWDWSLLTVVLAIVVTKMGLMAWYYLRDRVPRTPGAIEGA